VRSRGDRGERQLGIGQLSVGQVLGRLCQRPWRATAPRSPPYSADLPALHAKAATGAIHGKVVVTVGAGA
jgi:hypothetical protein